MCVKELIYYFPGISENARGKIVASASFLRNSNVNVEKNEHESIVDITFRLPPPVCRERRVSLVS